MSLAEYEQLRSVGKQLSKTIPEDYGLEKSLPKMIKLLGIGQGKNVILENEEEINFLIDFYLHEFISNSQTMLEKYRSDHPDLQEIEIAYLDAAKASYTSLFKVVEVSPRTSTITVIDLLSTSNEPLSVININLSKTAKIDYIIFSRLLPCKQFNAFSGMFAAFDEGSDRSLLKRYKVMKKRVKSEHESVQRFVACFKLNRILGIETKTQ
jgi:hypothetical protein